MQKTESCYIFESFDSHGCLAAFSVGRLNLDSRNNADCARNRKAFLHKLSVDYKDLVCLKQPHENRVVLAQNKDRGRGSLDYNSALDGYDAIITEEPCLPMAVFSADCLPIFFYDTRVKVCALAHAGWRGIKKNIISVVLEALRSNFQSRMQDILCGFGPAIRSCCYEVGDEFKGYFPKEAFLIKENKAFLDMAGLSCFQLAEAGICRENIIDSKICTSCRNEEFFSYRRERQDAGRMMSVIMIR